MIRACFIVVLAAALAYTGSAQEPGTVVPSIEFAPVGKVQLKPGESKNVPLDFRIASQFHVNSNKPHSEILIPTSLNVPAAQMFKPGTAAGVASLQYPAGEDVSFPFAPGEKLSVYSGDFSITAVVKASAKATAGEYPISGELRFQACDKSACYPPKSIPVKFTIAVSGK
jgi:hypothetical protein